MVEHSLGKGEVESSILSGSTITNPRKSRVSAFSGEATFPKFNAERCKNMRLFRHVFDTSILNPFRAFICLTATCMEASSPTQIRRLAEDYARDSRRHVAANRAELDKTSNPPFAVMHQDELH